MNRVKDSCFYCDKEGTIKCTACDAITCPEHTTYHREGKTLYPVCIACYEEFRKDNFRLPEEVK